MKGLYRVVGLGVGLWMIASAGAFAQENLDAGKSGAQLFASNCAICHKSPRSLTKVGGLFGAENFLKEHYTSSGATASKIADYLKSVDQGAPPESKRAAKPKTGDEKEKPAQKRALKRDEPKPDDKSEKKPDEPKTGEAKPDQEKPAAEKPEKDKPAEPASSAEKKPADASVPKQAESEFTATSEKPRKPKARASKKDKKEEPPKSD